MSTSVNSWYETAIKTLQLNGKSKRTQDHYARAVRLLSEFYDKEPEDITEMELREYFLHRKNVDKWASGTMRVCYSGIKFYYQRILRRDWNIFGIFQLEKEKRLPCVLSVEEVHDILSRVKKFHYFVFLTTVYTCGLRNQEARFLQVSDIDSKRMVIHVHHGKGSKDRYVPLPQSTYELLRQYWVTHRNPVFIFPALGNGRNCGPTAENPIAQESVQSAFRHARFDAGINKRRVTVHTLRHCYATHLLESGVNIRVIQHYMGHSNLETTMMYLHLTRKVSKDAYSIIDNMMKGFKHGEDK